MKIEEADKRKEELCNQYNILYQEIITEIETGELFPEEHTKKSIKKSLSLNNTYGLDIDTLLGFAKIEYGFSILKDDYGDCFESSIIVKKIKDCYELKRKIINLKRLVDMQKEFCGDIIITDPCYLIRAEHHGTTPITEDDWETCGYGDNMEILGIKNYMVRDTLYGDWSCTTYNSDTGDKIGTFCADAGLVGVFLLDEVLKYNPDFDYNHWSVTYIKDFKGTVEFKVVHTEGVYEETTKYWKAGDPWEDDSVEVHGNGINIVTGETIKFIGKQTGF